RRIWKTPATKPYSEKIRFVYMGTRTHDDDFYSLLLPAFKRLKEKYPTKFELTIVGALRKLPEEDWITVKEVPVECTAYPDFVDWLSQSSDYDVGLAPLVDSDFNRCKSDIKFLDYLALDCVPMLSKCEVYSEKETNRYAI